MDNPCTYCLLLAVPSPDLAVVSPGGTEAPRWRTSWRFDVRSLPAMHGVQLRQGAADAYDMSGIAMATKATQGGHIAANRGVLVTDTKFSTRLGPPPISPPV
jgi:hypothetical protein